MATPLTAEYENDVIEGKSRLEIIEELENLGVVSAALPRLSNAELENLLDSLGSLMDTHAPRPGRPKAGSDGPVVLTQADKKILCHFFSKRGKVTSLSLSKELGMPLSTVQRRKKRLEKNLIEISYSPRLEKLGWRSASLFILTSGGMVELGRAIMEMDDKVLSVTRIIGKEDADIVAQVVFRTNSELTSLIDQVKEKEGVRAVSWSEAVELIGINTNSYLQVIGD